MPWVSRTEFEDVCIEHFLTNNPGFTVAERHPICDKITAVFRDKDGVRHPLLVTIKLGQLDAEAIVNFSRATADIMRIDERAQRIVMLNRKDGTIGTIRARCFRE